ncbi:MAG: AraC family transcriptional regulator [Planctomycetota bacterium]
MRSLADRANALEQFLLTLSVPSLVSATSLPLLSDRIQVQYIPLEPPQTLSRFVENVFYLKGYSAEHPFERIVPDMSSSLVIELDGRERWVLDNDSLKPKQSCKGSWISGPHRQYFTIGTLPDTELLAVRFRLGGLYPLLKKSVFEVTDQIVPGPTFLGDSILSLRSLILDSESPEEKLQRMIEWLERNMDLSLEPPSPIQDVIQSIQDDPTVSTLAECMAGTGYSTKHVIDLFKKHVGLRPKDLQRIIRFSHALSSVQNGESLSWAALSLDCGYTDQSHFIRDFKRFSGFTPTVFRNMDSDRENFFPIDSEK